MYYPIFILYYGHSEKQAQDHGPMTQVFAGLKKAVDKLHFRGHRGKYCQENCDPWQIDSLDGVNTPVCEQVQCVYL